MTLRKTALLLAAAVMSLACSGDNADAGLFKHRARVREVYRYSARTSATSCPTATCPAVVAPTPQVRYDSPPVPMSVSPQASVQGEAANFLAALNHWRALHGRGPVGWDHRLASYAASNAGVHQPGSSGGAAQCWAGSRSLLASLEMWKASPPHANILLSARSAVGASPCPKGSTCNAM